jgi:tripartite-type tricarboxylate transporter receptor subunit TctC
MKLPRRSFLELAAGAIALPAVSRFAWAQAYPMHPVRIVVGYPAGIAPDVTARLIAQSLSERLGQQVIVDNRPGRGPISLPARSLGQLLMATLSWR